MKYVKAVLFVSFAWLPPAFAEKWWIVHDAAEKVCAEIPPAADGVDLHPEALKKLMPGCSAIITNKDGRFLIFTCPGKGPIGQAEFTSTRSFCSTMVDIN